jgi:cystinosin
VSNAAFYWSPLIREQYALRHGEGQRPTTAFNDIVFSGHALILSIITASQYLLSDLWRFEHATGTRPSRPSRPILGMVVGCLLAPAVVTVLVLRDLANAGADYDARYDWAWIDVVYMVSYIKLLVTLVKYMPQLVANVRNRSTRGWAIDQILLDFSGGVLSLAQLAIDSYLQGGWTGVTGNPVKFALGNVSMLYDVCFMTQHYILYPHASSAEDDNRAKRGEREALLESGRAGDDDRRLD